MSTTQGTTARPDGATTAGTRTATVPIDISCPNWCEVAPEEHARELWDNGGECFHHMPTRVVLDPTGIERTLEQPKPKKCRPIEVRLTTAAAPDGRETESPVVYIETASEHTVDQALALADAIREMVEQYRAAGGVA